MTQNWLESLPSRRECDGGNGDDELWLSGFCSYLTLLLQKIVVSPDVVRRYLEPVHLCWFVRAVTDPSVSAINYEALETLGDSIMATAFRKTVLRLPSLGPSITPQILSCLTAFYVSKNGQPQMASDLKLDTWIRVAAGVPVGLNRREDVCEAFFAALSLVGDAVHAACVSEKRYEDASRFAVPGGTVADRLASLYFNYRFTTNPSEFAKASETNPTGLLESIAVMFSRRGQLEIRNAGPRRCVFATPDLIRDINAAGGRFVLDDDRQQQQQLHGHHRPGKIFIGTTPEIALARLGIDHEWYRKTRSDLNASKVARYDEAAERVRRIYMIEPGARATAKLGIVVTHDRVDGERHVYSATVTIAPPTGTEVYRVVTATDSSLAGAKADAIDRFVEMPLSDVLRSLGGRLQPSVAADGDEPAPPPLKRQRRTHPARNL